MRRPPLALALVAVALAAAACSASTAPGWTYAPPTPAPTPGPSVAGSGSPSAAASGDQSAAPSATTAPGASASTGASESPAGGSAAPSDGGAATVVQVSAMNIAFEQPAITAPADTPFTIHFNNKEAVPHNVNIKDASGGDAFKGDVVTGPKEVDYAVPALAAGAYTFICDVHPSMTGTLTVGG